MRFPYALLVLFMIIPVAAKPGRTGYDWFLSSTDYHAGLNTDNNSAPDARDEHGIKEVIPKEFQTRYQKWKDELLATDYGRKLWEQYANRTDFLLTVKVAASRKSGAGTDEFEWDADGSLIAATVTLGKDLDKGYPDPVYYPVMNSLAAQNEMYNVTGTLLASTKMAHEIGHVTFTSQANSQVFKKQNRLMDNYYGIFLKNGFNTRDPKLVALESELGSSPLSIWEDREYWSEVSALHYLVQRISKESYYCSVINKIKINLEDYASGYESRFDLANIAFRPACLK